MACCTQTHRLVTPVLAVCSSPPTHPLTLPPTHPLALPPTQAQLFNEDFAIHYQFLGGMLGKVVLKECGSATPRV